MGTVCFHLHKCGERERNAQIQEIIMKYNHHDLWLVKTDMKEGGFKDNSTVSVWSISVWWCHSLKHGGRKVLEEGVNSGFL